jgi:hypothetical protein
MARRVVAAAGLASGTAVPVLTGTDITVAVDLTVADMAETVEVDTAETAVAGAMVAAAAIELQRRE